MTPMRRRRHVCFSLIVLGLCSLSMPNVGHVHGLSVPLNHRLFPAIAHAPHSSYPQLDQHPTLTHKRSQRAAADIAAASENDLLQELLLRALQDVHTRLALRKRAGDDEEEEKDNNYDGHIEEDDYNDHHDDNDNKGRQDDEGEETNGDHNGNDSSHQDENHGRDTDEPVLGHGEEAEHDRQEQDNRERYEREEREKKEKEDAEREAIERERGHEAEEKQHEDVDEEQTAEVNQGRETDNNNGNDHDLDGVSNRNDDSTSGFVSMPPGQESLNNTPNIAIIAGSVAGVVFLACVISGFVLLHKRQSQKRPMASETYFDRKIETHPMSSSSGRSNCDGGSGSFNSGSSGESKSGTILEKTQPESQPNKNETQERWSVTPLSSTMPALIPPEHAHFKYHLTDRQQGPENLYSMEEEDFEPLSSYSPGYYDPVATPSYPTTDSLQPSQQTSFINRPSRASYEQDFSPKSRFYPFTPRRINNLLPLAEEETLEVVSEPDSPIITADSFPVPPSTPVLHSPATLSPPPRARNSNTPNSRQGDPVNNDGACKVRLGSRGSRALLRNDPGLRTTFQPPMSMMSEPLTLSQSPSTSSMADAVDEATKKRVSVYDGNGQRLQAKRAGSLLFK